MRLWFSMAIARRRYIHVYGSIMSPEMANDVLAISTPMLCRAGMTLLTNYKVATAAYAECVSELHRRIGVSSKSEYELLKGRCEEGRHEADRAFTELERHVKEHGCDSEPLRMGADVI